MEQQDLELVILKMDQQQGVSILRFLTWVKNSSLGDGISIGDVSGAIGLLRRMGGLRLPGPIPGGGIKKFLKRQ